VFTYKTNEDDIAGAFGRWWETVLAIAIKEFGDKL
jgi:hypothetical protein